MAAIVYLDVDDEITSAAARIRGVGERRVALVLPTGSRVSTSRINFRLLAREATLRGRELAIVTPEGASRALAASAGLPVFASVAEYEDALEDLGPEPLDDEGDGGPAGSGSGPDVEPDGPDEAAADGGTTGAATETGPVGQLGWWTDEEAGATGGGSGGVVRGTRAGPAARGGVPGAHSDAGSVRGGSTSVRARALAGGPAAGGFPAGGGYPASGGYPSGGVRPRTSVTDTVATPIPDVREERRRRRFSGWLPALISVLIVALVVVGVAGWVFLPSATVTVSARAEAVGPLTLTVRADPLEVSEDVTNGIVPADVVTFDLAVTRDFPATGKKVTETKAAGSVRWTNCDPTRAYSIPGGTVVRTSAGEQFATGDTVFVPVAILSGNPPTITCQSRDVAVTARSAGTDGNVDSGTITVVPSSYNSVVVRVTNPGPTTGGTHTESKIVAQKDVDAAMAALAKGLKDEFTTQLVDPTKVPAGLTLFPATKSMSSGDPTVDPASLVGQAGATFTLGMNATGTATAVDPSAVQSIGDQRIRAVIPAGRGVVKGSVDVRVGTPRVDGSAVLYPVTARASSVVVPDAVAIRKLVKGLSVDDARERLRDYGDATVDVWPGWVTSITTYDFRLDVQVVSDVATEPLTPEPTATPSPLPTAAPTDAPSPADASPSGSAAPNGSGAPAASGAAGSPAASSRPRSSIAPSAAPSST